ncbi:hypothetical protein G6F62_000692 [Rhizopus arrhizus]|nr:hypothetical protein G6F23_001419 [Rhizopus arrhizus]KAG0790624.1 hypothetical protein G6F21_005673 [Rhizopus arrhizus]KAG0802148.1 hypothetical protein G6F22_000545 [Rhizopus arrhizus]KAG0812936.1 hypothetical protein G6F20_005959 [Rhizopus arrhizus]KAG0831411.1 hypothetical protein G6F19_006750 [Rhizopus arrhizus]
MSTLLKNVIPKTGQIVSRLGFGSYRVNQAKHAEALTTALEQGINIIDTANNFERGEAEKLIGNTLSHMEKEGKLSRKDVTLITKSGYLSAQDIQSFDTSDYVQLNEKSYHSISPKVIEKQIGTSLERLKTNKLDIFMINSPERMLMAKNKRYTSNQLYKDLAESFRYLDGLVHTGTIGGYGLCSNTMSFPAAADHVALDQVIQSCACPDHFVAIEVPFNLFEREAVIADSSQVPTVADIAKKHDVYVMTNRPLNAIANGQIRVLVNHVLGANGKGLSEQEIIKNMSQSFEAVTQLETDLMSELPLEEESLTAKFVWGQVLSENLARLAQNHFATRHYLLNQVLPAVKKDIESLESYAKELDEELLRYQQWANKYKQSIDHLTNDIIDYAYIDTLRKNSELDRILSALCPTLNTKENHHSPLTVKMLRFLLSHEEVGTVFTGMRDPLYVKDAVFAAKQELVDEEDLQDVWRCPIV